MNRVAARLAAASLTTIPIYALYGDEIKLSLKQDSSNMNMFSNVLATSAASPLTTIQNFFGAGADDAKFKVDPEVRHAKMNNVVPQLNSFIHSNTTRFTPCTAYQPRKTLPSHDDRKHA